MFSMVHVLFFWCVLLYWAQLLSWNVMLLGKGYHYKEVLVQITILIAYINDRMINISIWGRQRLRNTENSLCLTLWGTLRMAFLAIHMDIFRRCMRQTRDQGSRITQTCHGLYCHAPDTQHSSRKNWNLPLPGTQCFPFLHMVKQFHNCNTSHFHTWLTVDDTVTS